MSDQENPSDIDKSTATGNDLPEFALPDNDAERQDAAADKETAEEEQLGEPEPDGGDEFEEPIAEEEEDENRMKKSEQAAAAKKKKKQNLIKKVMEYDLADMYPEMSVLTDKRKREWDYQDPETIRALWLEAKTNVLAEWKTKYLTIKKSRKPQIEVRETTAQTLRAEYVKNKEEIKKTAEQADLQMIEKGQQSPRFDEVKLPTNITTDFRYKFIRNNPPVPGYYIEHFEKHKKPPFKTHRGGIAGCRL